MSLSPKLRSRAGIAGIVVVSVFLAVLSSTMFYVDVSQRERARVLFAEYTHDTRRPLVVATVDLAPRSDWLGGIIADAVLDDVYGEVDLQRASPEVREAWMELLPKIEAELRASREFLLGSLRSRPGWALHFASLGQLEYALQAKDYDPLALERWRYPLSSAATGAPGSDVVPIFHAAAEIELAAVGRSRLGAKEKKTIERSFRDPAFLQAALPATVALFGIDEALRLVPDDPLPLERAFAHVAAGSDETRAAEVWERFTRAEWKTRVSDLREAERVANLGDRRRLLRLVREWAAAHSARDFGREGLSQLVRLLRVWPSDDPGIWRRDPRTDMVAALLASDLESGSEGGRAVWRAVNSMVGVPEPIRAQAMLAGGTPEEAQRFALRSESAGTLEWTTFWIDAAREWLRQGDREKALFAVNQVSPSARDECEVLLARRELVHKGEVPALEAAISRARDLSRVRPSPRGEIPLCLTKSDKAVTAAIETTEPVLLEFLWDGTRYGTVFVPDAGTVRIPIGAQRGRSIVAIRAIDGPPPVFSVTVH